MTPEQTALVEQNLDVAEKVVNKMLKTLPAWADPSDLLSAAYEALVDAAIDYDPTIGEFRGYASKHIRYDLIDELRRVLGRGKASVVSMETVDLRNIPYCESESAIERMDYEFRREWLLANLWRLNESERIVIDGLLEGKLQREIAAEMGIHETRISQVRTAAIEKLREFIVE